MKSAKKWTLSSLAFIILVLSAIASLNFFMDPMWTFNHHHKYNDHQRARMEREQKSHVLYFRPKKYDTLIIGSSRTANMNQHIFSETTFNYAASDMKPIEYKKFIQFAIEKGKHPIKKVYIGLDFFGALNYSSGSAENVDRLLKKIEEPFYRYSYLLSTRATDYSIKNIRYTLKDRTNRYTYDNIRTTPPLNYNLSLAKYNNHIKGETQQFANRYATGYHEKYQTILLDLKKSFPDIEFTPFTTPVSAQQFNKIISLNKYELYERWLRETVALFPKVHHFMYLNDITNNANIYFQDAHHGYMDTNKCLANEMLGQTSSCPKIDMILTPQNITEKLKELRQLNGYSEELKSN